MSPPAGRPRKAAANLPAHIDGTKIPAGIYWDARRQHWYVRAENSRGGASSKRVAGADARLSELHALAEERAGVDRSTLNWLCREFERSPQFAELSASTRKDYTYCRAVLCDWKTRAGKFGDLVATRITRPLVQRLVDAIAAGTERDAAGQLVPTPSKAAHVRRYLSRVWEWGANRGHAPAQNPATGIDQPSERKRRRLPEPSIMAAFVRFAHARGQLKYSAEGALPPYLWAVAEIAYLCRLRGVEVVTLTEAAAEADGLRTNRRKGSRDNIVRWTPRLRAAWDSLIARRDKIWTAKHTPIPLRADQRPVVIATDGQRLSKSALDTAWQRAMAQAIAAKIITADQRFGLHDLKRLGITETAGTRADKQEASGHRSPGMMDVYDLSLPVVPAAGE